MVILLLRIELKNILFNKVIILFNKGFFKVWKEFKGNFR